MVDAVKSPNDAHTGKTFIQNEIELINFHLHGLKERNCPAHDHYDGDDKDRNDPNQNP